jgi:predicted RNase H-like HicB family nuclease
MVLGCVILAQYSSIVMECTIILTKEPGLHWRAFVAGWPECTAEASTRDEALSEVKHKLVEAVSHSEIVRVDLPLPEGRVRSNAEGVASDEWPDYGIFSNDPNLPQLFTEIENNRNHDLTPD